MIPTDRVFFFSTTFFYLFPPPPPPCEKASSDEEETELDRERRRLQVERADLMNAVDLFEGVEGAATFESSDPRTHDDFAVLADLIIAKIQPYQVCVRVRACVPSGRVLPTCGAARRR